MTAILDTSFLVALANSKDAYHSQVIRVAQNMKEPLILPVTVLPEVTYLIGSRLGHHKMRGFLRSLVHSNIVLETTTSSDLVRVSQILENYADSQLDFVDATIVAIAERLDVANVLTLDRRDFSIIRPKHCAYFNIFPE